MTDKNKNTIITFAVLALACVTLFLLFEIKHVPDVNWNQDYQYNSQEPHGAWAFQKLLKQSYGEENVSLYTEIDSFENKDKQLYINYGKRITIPLNKQNELFSFLENGNSILFISEAIYSNSDTLSSYDLDFDFYPDSLSRVQFLNEDSISYTFKFYNKDINKASEISKIGYYIDTYADSIIQSLAQIDDSLSVFYKRPHLNGNIYVYSDPNNFSNIAATQADYLNHFNQVFGHFDANQIILDNPSRSEILQNQYGGSQNPRSGSQNRYGDNSPLQYILSQPALAWAYYITLLGVLLYIIFRGKRKQRIIPITQFNNNTSLEYVDTISQIFLSQKQNRKLVAHIESIFYHNVRKKYFIARNHREFEKTFIQKSKIDENELRYVLDKFKNAQDGYEFTDTQLHSLYKKLELIYSKWK